MNKISIILPNFNDEKYLLRAYGSAAIQRFDDSRVEIEIVIVDDCSNDNSRELILRIAEKDKRVKYKFNDKNQGIARSINDGIALSSGNYIARLDADDLCLENRFNNQIKVLLRKKNTIASCNSLVIDEFDNILSFRKNSFVLNRNINSPLKKRGNFVPHGSVIFHTSLIDKVGVYKIGTRSEDYDLWLRAINSGFQFINVDVLGYAYRLRKSGISISNINQQIKETNDLMVGTAGGLNGANINRRTSIELDGKLIDYSFNSMYYFLRSRLARLYRSKLNKILGEIDSYNKSMRL